MVKRATGKKGNGKKGNGKNGTTRNRIAVKTNSKLGNRVCPKL